MNKDLQNHIDALKAYAEQTPIKKGDVDVLEKLKVQLEDIRGFIRGWERRGHSVADSVRDEEARLVAAIDKLTRGSEMGKVYKDVLAIAVRLGRKCQQPLQKDLREALTVDDGNTTSPKELRDLILQFLEDSGGTASLPDVMDRIEQYLKGHLNAADWDRLPRKERCRWEDNVLHEIRKMKAERILRRRGGSTLMLASRDAEASKRGQQGSQRLRWKRASLGDDCFDLEVTNPEALDIDVCGQLLEAVQTADGINPPHFKADAGREFQRWLSNLDTPLREQAYARLSNWFLTKKKGPLSQAALQLWNGLFCARPDRRLTLPQRNHKILSERFDLWWSKQQDCQSR